MPHADQSKTPTFRGLRFFQLQDDHLVPELRRLDYVLLAAVDRYMGEGYYLVANALGDPGSDYCSAAGTTAKPMIRLGCLNKFYSEQFVAPGVFKRLVVGKVAMTCKVQDRDLITSPPIAA